MGAVPVDAYCPPTWLEKLVSDLQLPLRSGLSQLAGLAVVRYILRVEPLASAKATR
jgi:hypothetical protein